MNANLIIKAIAASLPMSAGVAFSPLPVAAVIIMLMTARARTNAPAFLVGWILGILAVGLLVFVIPISQSGLGDPTIWGGWMRIFLRSPDSLVGRTCVATKAPG